MRWFWIYLLGVVVVVIGLLVALNGTGFLSQIPSTILIGVIVLIIGAGILGAVGKTKPRQDEIDIDRR
jgi:uncharacterized membrane protein HdeD (DUF308 family)